MIMRRCESDIWQMDCVHLNTAEFLDTFDETWNTSCAQISGVSAAALMYRSKWGYSEYI